MKVAAAVTVIMRRATRDLVLTNLNQTLVNDAFFGPFFFNSSFQSLAILKIKT